MTLTTTELNQLAAARQKAQERAATTGLAKAWTAQKEAAEAGKAVGHTQEELDKAQSQLAVMGTILRLQEESQKSMNTRLSIKADDLIQMGLTALGENI